MIITTITLGVLILLILILFGVFKFWPSHYNHRGFNKKGIHKNGTKYDESGYDYRGFDRNGYDSHGFDVDGFNRLGYCIAGYNRQGKNQKGQYNRFYDLNYSEDGFLDFRRYPIGVTNHARQRMMERMSIQNHRDMDKITQEAYCYGKSKRQVKKSSAVIMEEIEKSHGNGVLLIHKGYIYVFSENNVLITVYKNDRIPL